MNIEWILDKIFCVILYMVISAILTFAYYKAGIELVIIIGLSLIITLMFERELKEGVK